MRSTYPGNSLYYDYDISDMSIVPSNNGVIIQANLPDTLLLRKNATSVLKGSEAVIESTCLRDTYQLAQVFPGVYSAGTSEHIFLTGEGVSGESDSYTCALMNEYISINGVKKCDAAAANDTVISFTGENGYHSAVSLPMSGFIDNVQLSEEAKKPTAFPWRKPSPC